jgi:Flp pilus assembly protein TadG
MSFLRKWLGDESGVSALEFALVFPLALTLLLGTVDIGYALWLQRKLLSATQGVGDLLTREDSLNSGKVAEAIRGAELILQPFSATGLAYDLVGVEFLANNGQPTVRWRSTRNMTPDARFPAVAAGLGGRGEGVIGVVMTYTFRPVFSGSFLGEIEMKEIALLRGRRVSLIPYTS